jgi:two-component system cell cycle response regulator DivK
MKTILIAEDTDSNYLLVAIVLRKRYQLLHAMNGEEAVEMYHTHHPDAILMDVSMPVMNGWEATRIIREEDTDIPIIALTANAFDSDRVKSFDAGCTDYMTKPITPTALLNRLDQLFK